MPKRPTTRARSVFFCRFGGMFCDVGGAQQVLLPSSGWSPFGVPMKCQPKRVHRVVDGVDLRLRSGRLEDCPCESEQRQVQPGPASLQPEGKAISRDEVLGYTCSFAHRSCIACRVCVCFFWFVDKEPKGKANRTTTRNPQSSEFPPFDTQSSLTGHCISARSALTTWRA